MNRVVVTGIGVVSPVGSTREDFWSGLVEARSGIGPIARIPTERLNVRIAAEVRDFDPRAALDGGIDGLNYYRAIAAAVPLLLAPGGIVVVELGIGQAEPVAALFAAAGLAPRAPRNDLSDVPRALVASKGA